MLKGVYPVIPTLFSPNTVDLEALRLVVQFAIDSGAHGIVFPGVASESNFLTPSERGQLIETVVKQIDGQIPIVGGASASTADEVIAYGLEAQANSVKHLMIMAPKELGQDVDAHRDFFATISAALKDVEIILQNAPVPIGAGLAPKDIITVTASTPAITYVKEETLPSGPAITAIQEAGIAHLKGVFGGGGARYIIDELNRGALGAMPAIELADLHVAIYEAHAKENHKQARELYRLSLPLLVSQTVYRMRLTKYVLKQRGIVDCLEVRAPLPQLDEHTQKDINLMLADLFEVFP